MYARVTEFTAAMDALDALISEEDAKTTIITGAADVIIAADHTGNPTVSLPKTQPYVLNRGGTDVTSSSTWSATVLTGTIAASFSSAGILSLDKSGGVLTSATLRITATLNGVNYTSEVKVTRENADAPPATGGGTSFYTPFSAQSGSTSPAALTPEMSVVVGSTGKVDLSVEYSFDTTATNGNQNLTTQWYEWNGSAFVAVGSSVAAQQPYYALAGDVGTGLNTLQRTGKTVGSTQKYKLYGWNTGGQTGLTRNVYGQANAVGS